jgi:trk system potassium uptake protein TrkA
MHVIVIGAGMIGESLVSILINRGHDVVVVDRDSEKCIDLIRRYDVPTVNGDATIRCTLEEAGAEKADALVLTTNDDAVNVLSILEGKELGIESLISIVSQPEHDVMFKRLGAQVVENPATAVAEFLYKLLQRPSIRDFMSIAGGKAEILEISVTEKAPVVGKSLEELRLSHRDAIVVAIVRDDELIIPRGSTTIKDGDRAVVFALTERIEETVSMFAA